MDPMIDAGRPLALRLAGEPRALRRRASARPILESLANMAALITSSLDRARTLDRITESVAELLQVSDCAILLLDDDRTHLVGATGYGAIKDVYRELTVSLAEPSLSAAALAAREPIVVLDNATDPRAHQETYRRLGAKSTISLPMLVKDEPVGVLVVAETRESRAFSAGEVRLASAMAALAGVAIQNARLHARQQEAVWELHDGLGQTFGVIRLKAEMAIASLDAGDATTALPELRDISAMGMEGDRIVRACLARLRSDEPSTTVMLALSDVLDAFRATSHVALTVTLEEDLVLPPDIETALAGIVHEALHNVDKHARATEVAVRLRRGPDRLELQIEDDGRGFDPVLVAESAANHFGIQIMRQRASRIGGTVLIFSRPGSGTFIQVVTPDVSPMAPS